MYGGLRTVARAVWAPLGAGEMRAEPGLPYPGKGRNAARTGLNCSVCISRIVVEPHFSCPSTRDHENLGAGIFWVAQFVSSVGQTDGQRS